MKALDTSIIISTYNATSWLEKVLYGKTPALEEQDKDKEST